MIQIEYALIGMIVILALPVYKWIYFKKLSKRIYTAALKERAFSMRKDTADLIKTADKKLKRKEAK